MPDAPKKHHGLELVDRSLLSMTGVAKVESFDDREIVLITHLGMLTVRGENLHIRHLDLEQGDLVLDGDVGALLYVAETKRKGAWRRLLK
ncbi:MAG: sporulation protein YabP [Thermaerobacter sp.]|nr:sporulation protein YabP [Thermaerobacter sp.]